MIRDWIDSGPVGNNPFSNDRLAQGQRVDGHDEVEVATEMQTYNAESIPPAISLQSQPLGRLVTLDLKGNDIRVSIGADVISSGCSSYCAGRRELYCSSLEAEHSSQSFEPERE